MSWNYGFRLLVRFSGTIRLAGRRVVYRLTARGARQTLLSVVGVAIAVTLVLSVTSVSLGLATQGTVTTAQTDFWIVPEESQGSAVTGVEGTRFGRVHPVAAQLRQRPDVTHATPVLFDLVELTPPDGSPQRVFLLGVIPPAEPSTILGLPTESLTAGDPYYANGTYDGEWTGEAVLSASAATALEVDRGVTLSTRTADGTKRELTVEAVEPAQAPGIAQFPVVIMHLGEAQRLSGAVERDKADQILVDTTSSAVRSTLAGIYPASDVVSRSGLLARNLRTSDLPLAMSVAAGLIAVIAGTLTIVTTTGFELADDAETRAVMAALGVSRGLRFVLVICETLVTTLLGGVGGVVGWLVTVGLINLVAGRSANVPVAIVRPELALYGLLIAVGVGVVSLPFLLLGTRRGSLTEALPR